MTDASDVNIRFPSGTDDPLSDAEIQQYREEINRLDQVILDAIKQRTAISQAIGKIRTSAGGTKLVYTREVACPACQGARLRPEILAVRMASGHHGDLSIAGLAELVVAAAVFAVGKDSFAYFLFELGFYFHYIAYLFLQDWVYSVPVLGLYNICLSSSSKES